MLTFKQTRKFSRREVALMLTRLGMVIRKDTMLDVDEDIHTLETLREAQRSQSNANQPREKGMFSHAC